MLYIFDLGNVIVDIDFKRVLGVWSKIKQCSVGYIERAFYDGRGISAT